MWDLSLHDVVLLLPDDVVLCDLIILEQQTEMYYYGTRQRVP
jgi:magnesium-transporting ATPase (P-type)